MKSYLAIPVALALVLAACTLPSGADPEGPGPEELAGTMVAQTQQAAVPTATQPPQGDAATGTPSATTVSVSLATNCRTGPDAAYPLVLVFQPGATAEVVGKFTPKGYWIIKTPTDGTCWLWGEYASIQGDTAALPEMAAPPAPVAEAQPTETPSQGGGIAITPLVLVLLPVAPDDFSASANCQILDLGGGLKSIAGKTDELTWSGVGTATGYKLYVNGVLKKDLDAAITSTSFNALSLNASNYGVAAYNANGDSPVKTIPAPSCP